MKKYLILLLIAVLAVSLTLIVGCSDSDSDDSTTEKEVDVVDVDEPVSEGIYGEYEQLNGDGTISLYNDGTFTTGAGVEGDFELMDDESSLELVYDNGEKETWSIMISDGKVAAIADPDGEQYNKK